MLMIFNQDNSDLIAMINEETAERKTYTKPNLLDNWYFAGGGSQAGAGTFPINQRGSTSYTASGYGIDRWAALSAVGVGINDNYTTLTGTQSPSYFGQRASAATMAVINGKKLTISLLTSAGYLYTVTGIGGTQFSVETHFGWIYHFPPANELFDFSINNGSTVNVVAVKAEIGEGQTLAHQENGVWVLNEIPNYYDELAKCQKYLQVIKGGTNDFAIAVPYATNTTRFPVYTTVDTSKAISLYGSSPDAFQFTTGIFYNCPVSNNFTNAGYAVGNSVTLEATTTGTGTNVLTVGAAHRVRLQEGKTLIISAEL